MQLVRPSTPRICGCGLCRSPRPKVPSDLREVTAEERESIRQRLPAAWCECGTPLVDGHCKPCEAIERHNNRRRE